MRIKIKRAVVMFLAVLIVVGGIPGLLVPGGGKAYAGTTQIWMSLGDPGFSAGEASYTTMTVDTYGTPYVAYQDGGNGGKATVMKYNGTNWTPVGTAGFSAGSASYTIVTVDNGTPYVAYQDYGNGGKATVMKYNGTNWTPVGTAGFSAGSVYYPSLYVDNGTPYMAYQDAGNDYKATVMKYDGSSWAPVGTAGFSAGEAENLSLNVDNGTPYVAYTDNGTDSKATVMKYDGTRWSPVGSVGFSADRAENLSLNIDNGIPYLAYQDGGNGSKATVMKYDGNNWSPVGSVGFSADTAEYLSLYVDNGTPYLAYRDNKNNNMATVMEFRTVTESPVLTVDTTENNATSAIELTFTDDTAWRNAIKSVKAGVVTLAETDYTVSAGKITIHAGVLTAGSHIISISADGFTTASVVQIIGEWQQVGSTGFSAGSASYTTMTVDTYGTPYVAYQDGANGNKATVMKYDGTDWSSVGNVGFSAGEIDYPSLYIDNGTLYVAYQDIENGYKATVMKYDGTNWTPVGTAGFSAGESYNLSLYVDNGTLYVAYQNGADMKATVMKYDGSSWALVGTAGFSAGAVAYTTVTADTYGIPYIAYRDGENGGKATVMKYSGTNWTPVGTAVSAGSASYTTVIVDTDGTPYVAYKDGDNGGKATVMKYEGTNWSPVGNVGFSAGESDYLSLYVDNGTPYVAYQDGENGNKATVMKYEDTTGWAPVGNVGLSIGSASYTSLSVFKGILYVAYQDWGFDGKATVIRRARHNADLAGLTLSSGTLGPVFDSGTFSYTASVGNNVGSITVTPTVSDSDAAVKMSVNDGKASSVVNGQASGSLALKVGTNTIKLVVTAQDGITKKTYTVTVTRAPSASSDSGVPAAPTTDQTKSKDLSLTIDGKTVESIATVTSSEEDGQTELTVTVDSAKLAEQLAGATDNAVVAIPVTAKADKVSVVLSGDVIQTMGDKDAIVDIQTQIGGYKLPASEVKIGLLIALLGGQASDVDQVSVHVDIAKSDDAKVGLLRDAANAEGFTVVVPPVDFTVTVTLGDKSVTVDTFSSYVKREIPIPDGVNADMITAAVVLNKDGSTRSVPMKIVSRDGKSYAVINSLTNSTYALVAHPIAFSDVANHWAKDAINAIGSRMIISGTGNSMFSPDRDITRAEFAAIIVRGLGLKLERGTSIYSDVEASAWYNRAVNTANAYHLINGFEDGTFRPNDKITREQAMVMIANAMEITKLEGLTSEQTAGDILQPFADVEEVSSWAKDGVAESVQAGIVSGRGSKILAPKDFITRAEVATIIKRLLEKSDLI